LFLLLLAALAVVPSPLQAEPLHPLTPVPIQQVVVDDAFWAPKRQVWQEAMIPNCLDRFEQDGAITNFEKIRDGVTENKHSGPSFLDGLLYETIRGCADFLASKRDPALEARLDAYIDRIAAAAAKDENGYLNTYTQMVEPTHRWGVGGDDVQMHDVYNAGAMVEAAIHYYQATGKTRFLQVATKLANHMCDFMGPPPRKNVIPGHSLSEEALVKLYCLFRDNPALKSQMPVAVDEARYLDLAKFWIEQRGHAEGRKPFGSYGQDHKPFTEQNDLEGHSVRATLYAAGIAAIANNGGGDAYPAAALRLWDSLANRRTYITGGAGAVAAYEGFADDYELPNNGYLETCAAVGAGFFHRNMNLLFGEAKYVDELERALYNGAICGASLSGKEYSYVNPLVFGRGHGRWPWHGCPCCPPMFLKMTGAMPGYIYAQDDRGVYVNLFVGSQATIRHGGKDLKIRQVTRYPWDGNVRLEVTPEDDTACDLYVRIPGWRQTPTIADPLYAPATKPGQGAFAVTVNGQAVNRLETERGYAKLSRTWHKGDVIEVAIDMPVQRIKANPKVKDCEGRTALMRGPLVYAVESTDSALQARNLYLPSNVALNASYAPDLLGGMSVIQGKFKVKHRTASEDQDVAFSAIPYYAYGNRGVCDLAVWIPESRDKAIEQTIAQGATASASHRCPTDSFDGLNDGVMPKNSADASIPRFTWWDHRGTAEWVQYDFPAAERLSATEVYWWDDGHCLLPKSWRLLFREGDQWKPVPNPSAYSVERDRPNRVTFDAVETTGLRIEVQFQTEGSGGILEWRVE
jgi:DUF1680 family protein